MKFRIANWCRTAILWCHILISLLSITIFRSLIYHIILSYTAHFIDTHKYLCVYYYYYIKMHMYRVDECGMICILVAASSHTHTVEFSCRCWKHIYWQRWYDGLCSVTSAKKLPRKYRAIACHNDGSLTNDERWMWRTGAWELYFGFV